MDHNDVAKTLNHLIEVSRDGHAGFKACANDAQDPSLRSFFEMGAARCQSAIDELEPLVRQHGGKPDDSSSVSGALHRGWVNLKSALTGRDNHAVLSECERGEDYALEQYRKALEQPLPPDARAVVERQYQGVQANHDKVRALRDKFKSAA